MSALQPRLEVGEHEMDQREVLLRDLGVSALADSGVLDPAFDVETIVPAPIVRGDALGREWAEEFVAAGAPSIEDVKAAAPTADWESFSVLVLPLSQVRQQEPFATLMAVDLPTHGFYAIVIAAGDISVLPVKYAPPVGSA